MKFWRLSDPTFFEGSEFGGIRIILLHTVGVVEAVKTFFKLVGSLTIK